MKREHMIESEGYIKRGRERRERGEMWVVALCVKKGNKSW